MPETIEILQNQLAQYRAELDEMDTRRQKLLAAINGINAVLELEGASPTAPSSTLPGTRPAASAHGLTAMVRDIIDNLNDEFNVRDVMNEVAVSHPSTTVGVASASSTLRRLAKENTIRVVRVGAGKRPTIYGKVHRKPGATPLGTRTATPEFSTF